ncbi:uncharacterized protein LOC123707732 isoform X2 [Pieris brassicae]|uniref:uncharacterized protein LOC123707732 isoform X2 n=1 Tax=Pieris brassicae TaxID=7116 RepID=UPI001E65F61E|nr:uncharacterized protein LOC123707732 isoform X2 [Pieris brassicae]
MLIFTHFNLLVITSCAGYAEFEQFPGFDETKPDTLTTTITTSTPFLTNITLPIVRSSKKQQYRNMTSLATKAALAMESKCLYNKQMYAKCVKIAGKQCERYTKDSLANLEAQRLDVLALTEDRICNLSDMTADPLHLIKLIAQERATLDFALPGFLILLNNCSAHCIRSNVASKRKPLRHMTDQDLVIRHILTKKNYIQLINDSKHKA